MATYALVDGGYSTAEYLWANGIRPTYFLFSLKELEEAIAYCTPEEDSVLCVINGCTDIPMATVKEMIELLDDCKTIGKVTIFSNVPIYMVKYQFPYILFEGDLMTGPEYEMDTSRKVTHLTGLKPLPPKKRVIDTCKMNEATIETVDIGEMPHKYVPVTTDAVNRDDIIQINIFDKNKKSIKE